MLYWLIQLLQKQYPAINILHDFTCRSLLVLVTALLISLLLAPKTIFWLSRLQIDQNIREDGPQSHLVKSGTPTMGGVLIIFSIVISCLLWGNLTQSSLWIALMATLGFAIIGGIDDYSKVIRKHNRGLSAKQKYLWQSIVAILVIIGLKASLGSGFNLEIAVPFAKTLYWNIGLGIYLLMYLVLVGSSNAVNLTDGLDGLAILPVVMVAGALGIFASVTGNHDYPHYLTLPYLTKTNELCIFCAAIVGSGLGFLWYNTYPAQLFMGDVGSLSLGAALATVAIIIGQELVLFIMGGIFVIETLSVITQVGYFKLTGGLRLFRMAPLHHHFELKGWSETKVVVRFWIITMVLVLIGLTSLRGW